MCHACEEGLHYLCGMQTWCECDCAGPDEAFWGPSPDDDMPHADTCSCESCIQNYPERQYWMYDDDDDA